MQTESWHPNKVFDGLGEAAAVQYWDMSGVVHSYTEIAQKFFDMTNVFTTDLSYLELVDKSSFIRRNAQIFEQLVTEQPEDLFEAVATNGYLVNVRQTIPRFIGAVVTPILGVLHHEAILRGFPSVIALVEGSTEPTMRRICQPLEDLRCLSYDGALRVSSEVGEKLLKAAPSAHLLLSYMGLFGHMTDIARGTAAYGFNPVKGKQMVYRWQPHNAEASGGLLRPRVVPNVSKDIIAYIESNRISDAIVFDWGCGDALLLSHMMQKARQNGVNAYGVGVDIDPATQIPAQANFEAAGVGGDLVVGDMTDPDRIRDIISAYPGTHIHVTNYIPHDIRGSVPGSDTVFFETIAQEDPGSVLLVSESYRLTLEQYRDNAAAMRWFWLIHELSGQNLYTREELAGTLSSLGYEPIGERVHSWLGTSQDIVANSTLMVQAPNE